MSKIFYDFDRTDKITIFETLSQTKYQFEIEAQNIKQMLTQEGHKDKIQDITKIQRFPIIKKSLKAYLFSI